MGLIYKSPFPSLCGKCSICSKTWCIGNWSETECITHYGHNSPGNECRSDTINIRSWLFCILPKARFRFHKNRWDCNFDYHLAILLPSLPRSDCWIQCETENLPLSKACCHPSLCRKRTGSEEVKEVVLIYIEIWGIYRMFYQFHWVSNGTKPQAFPLVDWFTCTTHFSDGVCRIFLCLQTDDLKQENWL